MATILGIDAHLDTLAAAVCDGSGRRIDALTVANDPTGWRRLARRADRFDVSVCAIEGAGSYGAAAARFLAGVGYDVREVPTRATIVARRRIGAGKSDPKDALAAARAAQIEDLPRADVDPARNTLKVVLAHRNALVGEQTRAINQIKRLLSLIDPGSAAATGRTRSRRQLAAWCRYGTNITDPYQAVVCATIRQVASDALTRHDTIINLTSKLEGILGESGPRLCAIDGIGTIAAATIIAYTGDPARFRHKAAYAAWCGTSPLDASSGRQIRHRLNPGGNRQVNAVIYRAVLSQLSTRSQAHHYVTRRIAEGKTKKEAIRAAKRYLAHRIYNTLKLT